MTEMGSGNTDSESQRGPLFLTITLFVPSVHSCRVLVLTRCSKEAYSQGVSACRLAG